MDSRTVDSEIDEDGQGCVFTIAPSLQQRLRKLLERSGFADAIFTEDNAVRRTVWIGDPLLECLKCNHAVVLVLGLSASTKRIPYARFPGPRIDQLGWESPIVLPGMHQFLGACIWIDGLVNHTGRHADVRG